MSVRRARVVLAERYSFHGYSEFKSLDKVALAITSQGTRMTRPSLAKYRGAGVLSVPSVEGRGRRAAPRTAEQRFP